MEAYIPGSNRIQISNTKRPRYFYVNLSKQYIDEQGSVELSGLGLAVSAVVSITRILENSGVGIVKKIETETVPLDPSNPNPAVAGARAKLTVLLERGVVQNVSEEELMDHVDELEMDET